MSSELESIIAKRNLISKTLEQTETDLSNLENELNLLKEYLNTLYGIKENIRTTSSTVSLKEYKDVLKSIEAVSFDVNKSSQIMASINIQIDNLKNEIESMDIYIEANSKPPELGKIYKYEPGRG